MACGLFAITSVPQLARYLVACYSQSNTASQVLDVCRLVAVEASEANCSRGSQEACRSCCVTVGTSNKPSVIICHTTITVLSGPESTLLYHEGSAAGHANAMSPSGHATEFDWRASVPHTLQMVKQRAAPPILARGRAGTKRRNARLRWRYRA